MTWNLVATGAASNEAEEQALVAELRRVLSEPHAGTMASGFNGETHRGTVHETAPEPDWQTLPQDDEPQTAVAPDDSSE